MPNLSDKELDWLSREAAEKYEVEERIGTWNKLEELLNKELGKPSTPIPKIPKYGTPFFYVPVAILLTGLTSYFLLKPTKHNENSTLKNQQHISANSTSADRASVQQNASGTTTNEGDKTIRQNTTATRNADNTVAQTGKNKGNITDRAAGNLSANNSVSSSKTRTGTTAARERNAITSFYKKTKENSASERPAGNAVTANRKNTAGTKNKNYNDKPSSETKDFSSFKNRNRPRSNKPDVDDANENERDNRMAENVSGKKQNNETIKNTVAGNSAGLKKVDITGLQLIPHNNVAVNDAALKKAGKHASLMQQNIVTPGKKNDNRGLFTNRSLEFGFVFAPDFSKVKYDYNNPMGSNFGFTIGYQLTSRFSVNSGFIFAIKNYAAEGYNFHLPPNCGIDQDDLDFAVAHVHMYEIPLNIRYDFSKSGNTLFFVNAGASSYIAGKEMFKFYLHNGAPFGVPLRQYTTYKTDKSYWFSALNLSAGFESRVSNTISVQIEPYVKLPLTGVGFGKVNLSSYGINTSIRFAPVLKRSRR